ncbi:MAG TPA: HAMP domain-containing sensor histidine kinase [Clostridia bacterium]|nr:HAMP domain-containing sensor histidine kinase [Clostridia bacterium]
MKGKKRSKKALDKRINASLISFRVYLAIFAIVFLLIVGQTFIIIDYLGQTLPLIGTLSYYLLGMSLIFTILFGVFKRYIYGKPIRRIAKAARQITEGDFSVRVESLRKDGKKDEIEVLIEDFNKMAEELNSVETLKSDFIANVSHEIKSPLSVIQSYTMALKDRNLTSDEREEYADTVIEATQKLSLMVANILKLNKLENQEIYAVQNRYQLGEQLRRCALFHMESWQAKNIDFHIDVEDIIVNYDESLLEIVWNNLISNAVKFTEPGGNIKLSSVLDEEYIYVTIKDTGCGISAGEIERVFDKFYQGDASHSTQGNGLGLALVKKVLQIAEGEINIESSPNNGSTFTVKLKK